MSCKRRETRVMTLRVAVIGYGNVGMSALAAIQGSDDLEIAGIVRRRAVRPVGVNPDVRVVGDIEELSDVDAAVMAVPTRVVAQQAVQLLSAGISTVDSFDLHGEGMYNHLQEMDRAAREGGADAVVGAGWDPGTDSVVRTLMEVVASRGITYTNFGPGISLGHGAACRSLPGVRDAVSFTIPQGSGVHRREVYVQLEEGSDVSDVSRRIQEDPYFAGDETVVIGVDDVRRLVDLGHGVRAQRRGASADAHNTTVEFSMRGTNPAMTAEVMVCAARATARLTPGAHTMIDVPPLYLLAGDREELIRRLI